MRFKVHKRNVLAFFLTSCIALFLFVIVRKNASSNSDTTSFKKDYGDDKVQYSTMHIVATNKFQYDTVFNMRKAVYQSNYRQFIQNAQKFPVDPQLIIVVQVHNRPAYLKMLVDSLEKASEIHNVLLIFSHDYFSEEVSNIVQQITFCKVLQIYFPYSSQLYPNEFPGQDPLDCPRDAAKSSAIKMKCLNAEYPDTYGHYREASFTQTKHHWWWKLHFVWERVKLLQGYNGYVFFMEEDNYVMPDFYHIFKKMSELKKSDCPDCDVFALGNHDNQLQFKQFTDKVETSGWLSTRHNIGMGMSKEVYYKLMGCSSEFCTYDDYNWDWTLQHLSGSCIAKPLKVLAARSSRVLHTGNCGLHQTEACHPELALQKTGEVLESARKYLFPSSLIINSQMPVEHKSHMKNGGWGDIRDHALCKNYAKVL